MSLRTKVALGAALAVLVGVAFVGVSVYRATEAELRAEVDEDLLDRAAQVSRDRRLFVAPGDPGFRRRSPDRLDVFGPVVGFDAYARVVAPDGSVVLTLADEWDEPTDPVVFDEAAGGAPVLEDASSDDGAVRVVTVALPSGGFLQLARPLDEVEAVLADVRNRVLVIGGFAAVVAAVVAWVASRRTLRPVSELTDAAARVAATGDLSQPVEATGSDEVGRLAASFRTMLDALSASRQQQQRLVMDASHELRTPLTSLRTNVDVLGRGHALSEEDRAAVVADLDAELTELSDLVTELVDLAADVRTAEEPSALRLEDVATAVAERAERRSGRRVVVDVESSAVVEARPESVSRAVRNLVDNALKFSPGDSPVRVVVDGASVVVHDQGPGIPGADRELVFERFHRLASSRSQPGSGLGLAIVRQVAEAHGGTVWVEDSPDGGAAVGIRLG